MIAAFGLSIVVTMLPTSAAFGATVYGDTAPRMALTLPPVDLEPDYPALVLPPPETSSSPAAPSLAAMVRDHATNDVTDSELRCLATAVYFEAKGEPLAGQLAVAQVIKNRAGSGRFAPTLCGVVKQPSQFSFVRRGNFPTVANVAQWRSAVGVAHVAMEGDYKSEVGDALYFHARRVAPQWGKTRVAAVGNHLFYR